MRLISLFVSVIFCSSFPTQIYEPIYSYGTDRMSSVFFKLLFKELNFNQVQLWLKKVIPKVSAKSEYFPNEYQLSPGGWEHFRHQLWCMKNDEWGTVMKWAHLILRVWAPFPHDGWVWLRMPIALGGLMTHMDHGSASQLYWLHSE